MVPMDILTTLHHHQELSHLEDFPTEILNTPLLHQALSPLEGPSRVEGDMAAEAVDVVDEHRDTAKDLKHTSDLVPIMVPST